MRAAAVDRLHPFFFQLGQPIQDDVEVSQHEAEEHPAHQISESSEGDQRDRKIKQLARQALGLPSLLKNASMQQFVERAALASRIQHAVQRVQPYRSLQINLSENRLHGVGDISQINLGVIHASGGNLAEVLHNQEINLVANRVGLLRLSQKVPHQLQQSILGYQGIGLQELPQLVYLDLRGNPIEIAADERVREAYLGRPEDEDYVEEAAHA